MSKEDLTGSATMKEIADYYGVSKRTMQRRLIQYRQFFNIEGKKQIYYEAELQFIKKIFGTKELDKVRHE